MIIPLIEKARELVGKFTLSENDFTAGSVASALLTKSGNVYTGICLEVACGIGFCAEHSAIAEMLKNRETEIDMIVAVKRNKILPPCGRCRELMYQVSKSNLETKIIISESKFVFLREMLPFRWKE